MSFDFELRLVDSVGGPAKRAADAVRAIEEGAKKAQKALDFGKEIEKAEHNLSRLKVDPKGYQKLLVAQKELSENRKKLAKDAGVGRESFGEAIGKKFNFSMLTSAAFAGDLLAEGAMKIGEGLIEAAKSVVEIFTEGFKYAVEKSAERQTLELGARLSLGARGGGELMGDVGRFSGRTGFDDDKIAKMMLPLRRAGMDQQGARSAFAAAADIAAGEGSGGDGGRVEGLMDLFKKIRLKGGVTEKILVSLGVETKGFYADLSKQLGIGTEAAKKHAESGKIDPQLLLNTIYSGVEKRQGGILGTGAEAYGKTMEARLRKLSELPGEYFKTMLNTPAFGKLGEDLGSILERLNPDGPEGQRIIGKLQEMFSMIVKWIDKLASPAGMDMLVKGLEGALDVAKKIVSAMESMGHAISAVFDVANKLGGALSYAQSIGDKLTGKSSDDDEKAPDVEALRAAALEKWNAARAATPAGAAGAGAKSITISPKIEMNFTGVMTEDVKSAATEASKTLIDQLGRATSEAGAR